MSTNLLIIDGQVASPASLDRDTLNRFPADARIDDVSQFERSRSGKAITLSGLLDRAAPTAEATHVTLHSDDGFSACQSPTFATSESSCSSSQMANRSTAGLVVRTASSFPTPPGAERRTSMPVPTSNTSCASN
jgi:hypothetical protein